MNIKKITATICALSVLLSSANVSNAALGTTGVVFSYNNTSAAGFITYDESVFGQASYYTCGYEESFSAITENNYVNSYCSLTKYAYLVYKYDKALNCRVQRFSSDFYYIEKGNSKNITRTLTTTISSTYETSVVNTISNSITASGKTEIVDVEFGVSSQSTATVTKSIGESHTYTYQQGYSITDNLTATDSNKYYSWELRANFDVYFGGLFQINYNTTKTKHKTWYGKKYYTYSYTVASLELVDSMYYYEMIDGTSASGFYSYTEAEDGFIYSGQKNSFLTYID